MKGRPSTFENDAIIEKAQQVFWTKGFTASSLDDLLKGMGIGSGSFYNAFKGGKKELFSKALSQRRMAFKIFSDQLDKSKAPVELIKDFFRSLALADPHTHRRGCFIANTVTEMPFIDDDLEQEAIAILKEVEWLYTRNIKRAQENGSLKNLTDPALLGRYLITVYNGINVTRRMYPDKNQIAQVIDLQLEIIS
jgi:TetR/AcrR family transcriptional regulator, transcriptional repressor for nem operon